MQRKDRTMRLNVTLDIVTDAPPWQRDDEIRELFRAIADMRIVRHLRCEISRNEEIEYHKDDKGVLHVMERKDGE